MPLCHPEGLQLQLLMSGIHGLDYQPENMGKHADVSIVMHRSSSGRRHGRNICVFTHVFTLVIENRVSHML